MLLCYMFRLKDLKKIFHVKYFICFTFKAAFSAYTSYQMSRNY